jgi:hypothetical protein
LSSASETLKRLLMPSKRKISKMQNTKSRLNS